MRVRIHRGCREIGGSCVEVRAAGARLVLDVGKPLWAGWDEQVPLPGVPGLADGDDPSLLGVLISHPHLDHYGLLDQVSDRVPVYAGRAAVEIVNASSFFSPASVSIRPSGYLADREPIRLGPFTVTPWLVDHSGYDSYALLVEADGRRLFYTGDLRGHGRKAGLFRRLLHQPPQDVDVLLMEGTHVRGNTDVPQAELPEEPACSEADVERDLATTLRNISGLGLIVSSAQNIDRLVTVYRAARRAGRTLVVDLYTATIAQATGRGTIPQPGFPAYGVSLPNRQRRLVMTSQEFTRTDAVRRWRVYPEDIAAHPERYVLLTGSSTVPEVLRSGALDGGAVVWSLWPGYLREPSGQRLRAALSVASVPLAIHHASGHASVADLGKLVHAIKPDRLVPIHTEGADHYAQLFAGLVEQHHDGEWWAV